MNNKLSKIFLAVIICFTSIFYGGCAKQDKTNKKVSSKEEIHSNTKKIKIGTLKGPTGIGMVKIMEDNKDDYEFSLFNSPDQIVPKIINGELDVAAVPSNLAAVLYNKTKGKIKVGAVNTLGVLYVVENGNTIKNIKDLKGKTIYSSGKGATPEFIFNYILKKNGLDLDKDVKIEYKMQHADLAAAVSAKKVSIALLPEPFVTSAKLKNKELNIPINLTEEWDKVSNKESKLAMGTVVFSKDFADNKKDKVEKFLERYNESVNFVNKEPKEAGKMVEKQGIMPKAIIAEKAIPKCNIVCIQGKEAKEYLQGFYKVLLKSNPKSIGGKLPDEEFYYKAK